jgi:hypothetical protein
MAATTSGGRASRAPHSAPSSTPGSTVSRAESDELACDTSHSTNSPGERQWDATPLFGGAASGVRSGRKGATIRRIATLRLVREGGFTAPAGYPEARTPVYSPQDVYQFMAPYAAREVGESFWILALDSQHRVSAPTVITRAS